MYLTGLCRTVSLIHRRSEFRREQDLMQERVLKNPKIKPRLRHGDRRGALTSARARSRELARTKSEDQRDGDHPLHGVLRRDRPHAEQWTSFEGQLDLHDNGYIRTRPGSSYDERAGRACLWRRPGLHVQAGRNGCRHGVHGGPRCRAMDGHARVEGPAVGGRVAVRSTAPRPPRTSPIEIGVGQIR